MTPAQFPDFLGLKGDSSDNIPGVPGIGDKGAAQACFRPMGASTASTRTSTSSRASSSRTHPGATRTPPTSAAAVATIVRDLDFPLDIEDASFPSFDVDEVTAAFRAVRFNAHLTRVLKLVGEEPAKQVAPAGVGARPGGRGRAAPDRRGVRKGRARGRLLRRSRAGVAVQLRHPPRRQHGGGHRAARRRRGAFRVRARSCATARSRRSTSRPSCTASIPPTRLFPRSSTTWTSCPCDAFDLGLAGYVLNSSVTSYSYDALLDAYVGGVLPEAKDDDVRAASQAAAARRLAEPLERALERDGSLAAYRDIDLPLVAVLAIMERTGAAIDTRAPQEPRRVHAARARRAVRAHLRDRGGGVQPRLAQAALAHPVRGARASSRARRTSAATPPTRACSRSCPPSTRCRRSVLRYRELAKIKSTYIDTLPRLRAGDGRVHTTLQRDGHHHRPPVLVGSEPPEHPRAHRVRPPDPHLLRAA